jgi:transcriptional regulator with XRE-family HTH domain
MATTSTKRRKDAGERLKGERERLGYAPRQIAQLLGVPLEAYDAFESG